MSPLQPVPKFEGHPKSMNSLTLNEPAIKLHLRINRISQSYSSRTRDLSVCHCEMPNQCDLTDKLNELHGFDFFFENYLIIKNETPLPRTCSGHSFSNGLMLHDLKIVLYLWPLTCMFTVLTKVLSILEKCFLCAAIYFMFKRNCRKLDFHFSCLLLYISASKISKFFPFSVDYFPLL